MRGLLGFSSLEAGLDTITFSCGFSMLGRIRIVNLRKETNQFVKLRLRGRELDRHQVSADNRMIY